jgi:hypothetical protein
MFGFSPKTDAQSGTVTMSETSPEKAVAGGVTARADRRLITLHDRQQAERDLGDASMERALEADRDYGREQTVSAAAFYGLSPEVYDDIANGPPRGNPRMRMRSQVEARQRAEAEPRERATREREKTKKYRAVQRQYDLLLPSVEALAVAMSRKGGGTDVLINIPKGATIQGQAEVVRSLKKERGATDAALPPIDGAKRQVRGKVAMMAQGFEAIVVDGQVRIRPPIEQVKGVELTSPGMLASVTDAAALVAWLAPDKVIEHLEAQLDADYAGQLSLSDEEKRKRLADLDAKILAAERIEAELVWQAIERGESITFRPDIDPRAVLGIA